ncbi:hypothetical protein Vadar_005656 [Vaccinium darrowii]|uniref:Uncharacterized protein n=1 Tax=Vaccinium darrowii TaxID=229202 RepID=A0ACB7YU75_9ERIC|nr:hypothetical protein Vadar_005656 [Vaccinium darrowii]
MITCASLVSNSHGRRLPATSMELEQKRDQERLYRNALPKGPILTSSPSNKGQAVAADKNHFHRHLAAIPRILRSVPSPGVGH